MQKSKYLLTLLTNKAIVDSLVNLSPDQTSEKISLIAGTFLFYKSYTIIAFSLDELSKNAKIIKAELKLKKNKIEGDARSFLILVYNVNHCLKIKRAKISKYGTDIIQD